MRLALFDFDGTITSRDTLPDFIIFYKGFLRYLLGIIVLSPILTLYVLRLISNSKAKEMMIGHFFKGYNLTDFEAKAEEYSLTRVPLILRPEAMDRINYHKENSDRIIVVSASIDLWIKPWCDLNNIELISTKLQVQDGILTGKFDSNNCNGPEKVIRINQYLKSDQYQNIFVYGDSNGDNDMLNMASKGQAFRKKFISND